MEKKTPVTFEKVLEAASAMRAQGITPKVRDVIQVTGGKTETVAKLLRDVNDRRNAEISKMAVELGSSKIAELLADQVQSVLEQKLASHQEVHAELKGQFDEAVDLLEEKEQDCNHRIEMAEAQSTKAINEANAKVMKTTERAELAEQERDQALQSAQQAREDADQSIKAIEDKCDLLVTNAKNEAASLVKASDRRADRAEQECTVLRDQVQSLTVEQAKRELEQAQHEKTLLQHEDTLKQLADARTVITQLRAKEEAHSSEITRLTTELTEAKSDGKNLAVAQGQLVELTRTNAKLQSDLALSEREREALTLALNSKTKEA